MRILAKLKPAAKAGRTVCPLVLALALASPAGAQGEAARGIPAFGEFRLLIQRNIFDPSRRKPAERPVAEAPPAPRVDELVLSGTLVTDAGAYAFFEGSRREYARVVETGGEVAGCVVTGIGTSGVVLSAPDGPLNLDVGRALAREGDRPWELAGRPSGRRPPLSSGDGPARVADGTPTGGGEAEPGPADAPSEDTNDVLRRMMERRRQEMEP